MTTIDPIFLKGNEPWPNLDLATSAWNLSAIETTREFVRAHRSTGFIVMQHGRLVCEDYWPVPSEEERAQAALSINDLPDGRTEEDVASVQKSITSMLVGIAVARDLLSLDDPVRASIGRGWSRAEPDDEDRITVRHLLTMTSGLNDRLEVVGAPGTIWDYNLGAGYHTLKKVVSAAGGGSLDEVSTQWLFEPLGMTESRWTTRSLPAGLPAEFLVMTCYPNGTPLEGLTTTARDLARFGLAVLAGGRIGSIDLGVNPEFLREASSPSSTLNPSYGLLWWINGQDFAMLPKVTETSPGWLFPDAPADTIAALGALGRAIFVVPSHGLVVVRLGLAPDTMSLDVNQFGFHRDLWTHLSNALPHPT